MITGSLLPDKDVMNGLMHANLIVTTVSFAAKTVCRTGHIAHMAAGKVGFGDEAKDPGVPRRRETCLDDDRRGEFLVDRRCFT